MEVEAARCVHCDKRVEGKVESVALTLCCSECCKKSPSSYSSVYKGRYRTSKTRAMTDYGCTHADLSVLDYESQPNPVDPKGRPMKLYLKAEAEYLGNKRREMQLEEKAKRELGAIIGKKSALEMRLGTNLGKMDRLIRHFLLGDYLSKGAETKTSQEDVEARYAALPRVVEILKTCPGAHPEAAFTFCLDHPTDGPAEFQALKEKVRAVFRLEGARIFHKLPYPEHIQFYIMGTPLEDVYEEFLNRDSRAIVRGHLLKWCSEQTADQIISYPACQSRLDRRDDEEMTAKSLMEFWNEKDDRAKRMERLKAEFELRKVLWPPECQLCEMYVNGEIDCDPVEIVGIKEVHGLLNKEQGIHPFSNQGLIVRSRFVDCLYARKMGYGESVEQAFEEAMTTRQIVLGFHHAHYYDIDMSSLDSYDYSYFDDDESSGFGNYWFSDDTDFF